MAMMRFACVPAGWRTATAAGGRRTAADTATRCTVITTTTTTGPAVRTADVSAARVTSLTVCLKSTSGPMFERECFIYTALIGLYPAKFVHMHKRQAIDLYFVCTARITKQCQLFRRTCEKHVGDVTEQIGVRASCDLVQL